MRNSGRAECLAFVFYPENYGRGLVTVDDKGNPLKKPRNYPKDRDELIMKATEAFSPHGIMIGLHDDNPPDKDHEHWYFGFENNRMQPSDFEPIAYDLGFVVKPKEVYINRPDTLDDYIKHISNAAVKDLKKEYDDSHIWKSEYWDPQLYMSTDTKKNIKREQRETEVSQMDSTILQLIDHYSIGYFPELLDYLQPHPALYNYVLMQRSSFYFMYLRELRECEKALGYKHKKKYPDGTNSKDGEPYKPTPEPVKMTYSESQAALARSTDEVFGAPPVEPPLEESPAEAPAEADNSGKDDVYGPEINFEDFEVIGLDGENPFE